MAEFPGITGRGYSPSSIKMTIDGDVVQLRSVSPGGREVTQEHVFRLGSFIPVALITGSEKPRELAVTVDPVSYTAWLAARATGVPVALLRISVSVLLESPGNPSILLEYENCGLMGDEFPEMVAGEATEFNAPIRFMPTAVKVNGGYLTTAATDGANV